VEIKQDRLVVPDLAKLDEHVKELEQRLATSIAI
jgi:hypothetical protein